MRIGQPVILIDVDGAEHRAAVVDIGGEEPGFKVLDIQTIDGSVTTTGVLHESKAADGQPRWKLPE